MDIVALVALAGGIDDEAPKLAADLGVTAYEAALLLRASMPAVVLRTDDRARTLDLLGKLRARGHEAVACDLAAVVSSADMYCPKSFRFEDASFIGVAGVEERRLPLSSVFAFVRATLVVRSEETVVSHERKLSIGRAALTGGLLMSKTTSKESKKVTTEREPALYLFHDAGSPWLLVSSDLRYDGLEEKRMRSRLENFEVLERQLREGAPEAAFDNRLLQARAGSTDVLVHLVAMSLHRKVRA